MDALPLHYSPFLAIRLVFVPQETQLKNQADRVVDRSHVHHRLGDRVEGIGDRAGAHHKGHDQEQD